MGKHKPIWAPHVDTGDHVGGDQRCGRSSSRDGSSGQALPHPLRLHRRAHARLGPTRCSACILSGPSSGRCRACCRRPSSGARWPRSSRCIADAEHPHQAQQPTGAARTQEGVVMAEVVQFYGTGRRRTSVARVFLRTGQGRITDQPAPVRGLLPARDAADSIVTQPLELTRGRPPGSTRRSTSRSGGLSGQAGAVRHGIARALLEVQHGAQAPAQAGGDAHARPANEGAEEVRTAGRAQALPVLEAVVRIARRRPDREGPGDLPGFWRGEWCSADHEWIDGGITAVPGILAAGLHAGIKPAPARDLALVHSSTPATAAGVFTTNRIVRERPSRSRESGSGAASPRRSSRPAAARTSPPESRGP